MIYPVKDWSLWYIATEFGHPESYGFHEGEDINLKTGGDTDLGQPLIAVADGKIVYFHNIYHPTKNFGRHMVLECETSRGKRWYHYAHCEEITAESKQVKMGEVIGKLGKSGTIYAHLHFAVFKVDPGSLSTGIDSIAQTTTQLNTIWEDFELLDSKVSNLPLPPVGGPILIGSDDLNLILAHYKVKTVQEFVTSNDQQLQYLTDARNEITGLKTTLQQAQQKFSTFVQNVVDKLNPIHPIAGMVDETVCLGLIDELVASVSQTQTELKNQQKLSSEAARISAEREKELMGQIDRLTKTASQLKQQISDLQNDIEKVRQNQETQQSQTAQINAFQELTNKLLALFKRKS